MVDGQKREVKGKKDIAVGVVVDLVGLSNHLSDDCRIEAAFFYLPGPLHHLFVEIDQTIDVVVPPIDDQFANGHHLIFTVLDFSAY